MEIKCIQYLRVLLTNNCNMSCSFCHKEGCDYNERDLDETILIDTIKLLYRIGYRKIKLMGGEPMLYKNIDSVICEIKNIGSDIDLSMISNGSANLEQYERLFNLGLDRLNISVHGWKENYFKKNAGASTKLYNDVKDNIIELAKKGRINKLNYVLKRGINENDFYSLVDFAKAYELVIDALNLLTFEYDLSSQKYQYSFDEIEQLIRERYKVKEVLQFVNPYSLASKRLCLDNGVKINLKINKLNQENIFLSCKECSKKCNCVEGIKAIRLTNDAIIQPCLLRTDNTLDLKENYSEEEIINYLRAL